MVNKVMKVFYGENCLPYKDKSRTVIYPVIGSSFLGASNTTEIWFYFDKIGEPNNTWVAIAKLPNGKRGAVKLDTFTDTELNEPYAKLQLNTWFTQMRGDVYISLNGYDGGITLSLDQETGLYEVTGTPVIQATGSVKLTIQYATQLIGGDEVDEITLQEIYAMFGEKLDTNKGIVVIANPQVDISGYDNGQYFYSKSDNSIYENVSGVPTLRFTAYSKSENDALLATKVDKTTDTNIVYGTDNSGEQYKVPYSNAYSGKENNLVQRDSNAQIYVPTTPTDNNHATSKGYVDTQRDTRVAKTNAGDKVYGTDESGNQKTFDVDSDLVSGENGIVVRRLYPNGQVIVGNPSATNHATPKQYVDNNFAHTLDLTIDSNFDLVVKLLNANGVVISQDDVDLPLESIVVSATYYDTYTYEGVTYNKVIVIVLSTTSVPTIIPVGDLVSGLVSTDELATALSSYYTKTQADNKFVEKVSGKGLSSNDFTDSDKTKLNGIESGAQVNVIEEIKVDNVALTPTDKSVNIDLSGKQDTLVSGTNIKSINNTSLLGSGNIDYDNALSDSSTNAVQNKVLKGYLDDIGNRLAVLEESIIADDSLNYTYLSDSAIPTNANTYPIIESAGMDNTNIKGNSVVYNQLFKTSDYVNNDTRGGVVITRVDDATFKLNETCTTALANIALGNSSYPANQLTLQKVSLVSGSITLNGGSANICIRGVWGGSLTEGMDNSFQLGTSQSSNAPLAIICSQGVVFDNAVFRVELFNLTQSGITASTADEAIAELLKRGINVYEYNPYNVGVIRNSKPTNLYSRNTILPNLPMRAIAKVDLGTLTWNTPNANGWTISSGIASLLKAPVSTAIKANMFCSKYLVAKADYVWQNNETIGSDTAANIVLRSADFVGLTRTQVKDALNGVYLYFELATPLSQPSQDIINDLVIDSRALNLPVLRSAGSVQDDVSKVNVIQKDMGDLNWDTTDLSSIFQASLPSSYNHSTNASRKEDFICSSYPPSVETAIDETYMSDKSILINGKVLFLRDTSLIGSTGSQVKTAMVGKTINYRIDTPTDQPAITLPENIEFEKGGSLEVTYDETAPTPADFDFEVAVYKPIE